ASARCRVPANAPPGAYALAATAGSRTDWNGRAVYVRESFPDTYRIAHVAGSAITAARGAADGAFGRAIEALNEAGPAFAVITGDLTREGTADQFRRFLELLDTCAFPTFVCAGPRDHQNGLYESTFGTSPEVFSFGADAFLTFDSTGAGVPDDRGAQPGGIYRARRAIRPARWSVGFTYRYGPDLPMRTQIALFVDDPLDALIVQATVPGDLDAVPWGRIPVISAPPAGQGAFRLIELAPRRILPAPPDTAPGR
ncbi:MAG: hypothetical protein JXR94_23755, partial [Candidatus Hydrogenedentes bacterium]|nr:hypothetical protein [Candidatus Hydrogenedentota bacterium]